LLEGSAPSENAATDEWSFREDKLAKLIETVGSLNEGVVVNTLAFEITIVFFQVCAAWLTIYTLYRSRTPSWANHMLLASSASLLKYVVYRLCYSVGGCRSLSAIWRVSNTTGAFTKAVGACVALVMAMALFVSNVVLVGTHHAPASVFYFSWPVVASMLIFRQPIAPLPDLYAREYLAPLEGATTCDFGAVCALSAAFRMIEAVFFTSGLPLLLNEDPNLVFDHSCVGILAAFAALTTAVLLAAETVLLNRLQLVAETRQAGAWHRLGNAAAFPGLDEWEAPKPGVGYPLGARVVLREAAWEAAGRGITRCAPGDGAAALAHALLAPEGAAPPRASRVLLGCAAAQGALIAAQLCLVLTAVVWVPYAALLVGSFASMVRVFVDVHMRI
jgi:hypothetical protein